MMDPPTFKLGPNCPDSFLGLVKGSYSIPLPKFAIVPVFKTREGKIAYEGYLAENPRQVH